MIKGLELKFALLPSNGTDNTDDIVNVMNLKQNIFTILQPTTHNNPQVTGRTNWTLLSSRRMGQYLNMIQTRHCVIWTQHGAQQLKKAYGTSFGGMGGFSSHTSVVKDSSAVTSPSQ